MRLRQVDPASSHRFPDGTVVELPNASRAGVVQALDAALAPGAGERWSELINRARDAWDATRRPLLEEPLPPSRSGLRRSAAIPIRRRPAGLFRRSGRALWRPSPGGSWPIPG